MLGMTKQSKNINSKRLKLGAFFILAGIVGLNQLFIESNETDLLSYFNNHQSGRMVEFKAEVIKLLADDNKGSRHQRFIVKTENLSVLIAHNIDLAERVPVKQ